MSISELRTTIDAGNLGKFTVADLKSWLASKGLNSSGKKADLVERIEQWVEEA
jgi:ATP-dependent DNA helicase 2 subunit 1